jgi:opacity protein-like surface antigen
VSIFVGGGIGASLLKYDANNGFVSGKDDDVDFAWQVGLGADYELTDEVSIEGGYRYVDLGEGKSRVQQIGFPLTDIGDYEIDLAAHELYVGFRYRW